MTTFAFWAAFLAGVALLVKFIDWATSWATELWALKHPPPCGHSACRQHWIDTGRPDCVYCPGCGRNDFGDYDQCLNCDGQGGPLA